MAISALQDGVTALLESKVETVALAAMDCIEALEMKQAAPSLSAVIDEKRAAPKVRSKALTLLAKWRDPKLGQPWPLAIVVDDPDPMLRVTAAAIVAPRHPDDTAEILTDILKERDSGVKAKQAALAGMPGIPLTLGETTLLKCLDETIPVPLEAKAELFDAASASASPKVHAALRGWERQAAKDALPLPLQLALWGGDAVRGRALFEENANAGCIRCHRVNREGGQTGPDLSNLGARLDRRTILECMVAPSGDIASKRRPIALTLKSGAVIVGRIEEDTASEFVLGAPEELAVHVKKADVATRELLPSGMPQGYGAKLTRNQIRDLVEYLADLKRE